MRIEPVFCQNCGRVCKEVCEGRNGLPYCSHDCEITDRLIVKYEWQIVLTIFMLVLAMVLTEQYMEDKYSPTTQEQEKAMTEQEKAISRLCLEMQSYCNDLRVDHNFLVDSYNLECIDHCIEKIHRMVNPEFNKICEDVEAFEREQDDE